MWPTTCKTKKKHTERDTWIKISSNKAKLESWVFSYETDGAAANRGGNKASGQFLAEAGRDIYYILLFLYHQPVPTFAYKKTGGGGGGELLLLTSTSCSLLLFGSVCSARYVLSFISGVQFISLSAWCKSVPGLEIIAWSLGYLRGGPNKVPQQELVNLFGFWGGVPRIPFLDDWMFVGGCSETSLSGGERAFCWGDWILACLVWIIMFMELKARCFV